MDMDVEQMVEWLEYLGIAPPRLAWARNYDHWAFQVCNAFQDSLLIAWPIYGDCYGDHRDGLAARLVRSFVYCAFCQQDARRIG